MATALSASVQRLTTSARKRTLVRCLDSRLSRSIILAHRPSRCYSTESTDSTEVDYANLPPPSEWRSLFLDGHIALKERPTLSNPETADKLVDAFINNKETASKEPKVIIEAFPGECSQQVNFISRY